MTVDGGEPYCGVYCGKKKKWQQSCTAADPLTTAGPGRTTHVALTWGLQM